MMQSNKLGELFLNIVELIIINSTILFLSTISLGLLFIPLVSSYCGYLENGKGGVIKFVMEIPKNFWKKFKISLICVPVILISFLNIIFPTNLFSSILSMFILFEMLIGLIYIPFVINKTELKTFKTISFSIILANINFGYSIIIGVVIVILFLASIEIVILSLIFVPFIIYIVKYFTERLIERYIIRKEEMYVTA